MTGAGTAFFLYNRATEVNRSTPTVAVHQFLGAVFVDQSDDRVRLFTCPEWAPNRTTEMRRRFDPEVKVSWGLVTEQSRVDDRAEVIAELALKYPGEPVPSGKQRWQFEVVEDNGWRVCGAEPVSP